MTAIAAVSNVRYRAEVLLAQGITKVEASAGSMSYVALKLAEPTDGSDGKAAAAAVKSLQADLMNKAAACLVSGSPQTEVHESSTSFRRGRSRAEQ